MPDDPVAYMIPELSLFYIADPVKTERIAFAQHRCPVYVWRAMWSFPLYYTGLNNYKQGSE